MSGCIGIELDAHCIRALRLGDWRGRRPVAVEVAWDPDLPQEGVEAVRERLGRAHRVAVAVRLPLLFVKRVKLPPLPGSERRRILRLEPQRYFPVRLDDVVVAVGRGDLVFAAREERLAMWLGALETLGRVEVAEPGPVALARALGATGIRDAVVLLDDAENGVTALEVAPDGVEAVRRIRGSLVHALAAVSSEPLPIYVAPWDDDRASAIAAVVPGRDVRPLPGLGELPPSFLAAWGAALGASRDAGDGDATLLPDDLQSAVVNGRRRRVGVAALAFAAAALFALDSLDAARARAVRELQLGVHALERRAAPVLALQEALARTGRQADAIARLERGRADPLAVMLALSRHLPAGAHLRSLGLVGALWQIDGFAPQAAKVTQSLGGAPGFRDVRVLAATNRSRIGDRNYESFSLAFRFVPTP